MDFASLYFVEMGDISFSARAIASAYSLPLAVGGFLWRQRSAPQYFCVGASTLRSGAPSGIRRLAPVFASSSRLPAGLDIVSRSILGFAKQEPSGYLTAMS